MKEAQFFGNLLPAHPAIIPIIKTLRDEYNLHEVNPEEEPIEEIYLGDKIVTLEEFRQEIKNRLIENLEQVTNEDFAKKYKSAQAGRNADFQKDLARYPSEIQPAMKAFLEQTKTALDTMYTIFDAQVDGMADMLYIHLLMGETWEAPEDWFGKIFTMNTGGKKILVAMANEITNVDLLLAQFRAEHKKTFGQRKSKITKTAINTAYYVQLKKKKKDVGFYS